MRVTINGEPAEVPEGLNVAGLLDHLGIEGSRVAIELNREIVRKAAWEATPVPAGSEVEIVQFVGGG